MSLPFRLGYHFRKSSAILVFTILFLVVIYTRNFLKIKNITLQSYITYGEKLVRLKGTQPTKTPYVYPTTVTGLLQNSATPNVLLPPPSKLLNAPEKESPILIPHIIHQTWDSRRVPQDLSKWIKTWPKNHPDWEYWFWTPDDVRLFLSRHYPEFLNTYDTYPMEIYRSNAMRYFIMYHYGGVYADLDLESLKALDAWTYRTHCLLPEETYAHPFIINKLNHANVMITILACRPGHPFHKHAIDMLPIYNNLTNLEKLLYVDRVFLSYNQTVHEREEDQVYLAHPDYFLPTFDKGWSSHVRGYCGGYRREQLNEYQQAVCKVFRENKYANQPVDVSYTNHHWFHTVLQKKEWKYKHLMPIEDIVENIVNVTEKILKSS